MDLVVFAIFSAMFYGILFIVYFERLEHKHSKELNKLKRRYEQKSEYYVELINVLETIEAEVELINDVLETIEAEES